MFWVVILLCFSLGNCDEVKQPEDKLIFTQILFRHGARNLRKSYANDPWKDKCHWPGGFGHLTNVGKRQAHELGQFLHQRYDKFIGIYSPDKVSILSSDYDRTINSANLVLAALFPPSDSQIWNENLLWQPIAVHSIPKQMDYLIDAELACARYMKALEEYETSSAIEELIAQHQKLFEYLEKHTGQPIRNLVHMRDLHEILHIEHQTNKTLPEWTHEVFIPGGTFEYLAHYWFTLPTGTTELKKLKSGFLLKEILDRFKSKTLSLLPDQLLQIYSGHDYTIVSILNSLGVFEFHLPPYSSSVLFELYESSNSYYVQIFYRNSTAEPLTPLNIPNCGHKCSLNQMYNLYSDILPSDPDSECRLPDA